MSLLLITNNENLSQIPSWWDSNLQSLLGISECLPNYISHLLSYKFLLFVILLHPSIQQWNARVSGWNCNNNMTSKNFTHNNFSFSSIAYLVIYQKFDLQIRLII